MAFALCTHLLLFLSFSGVNQLVHPSSDSGSELDSEYPQYQQSEESRRPSYLLPLTEEYYREYQPPEVHHPPLSHPQARALSLPPMHIDPIQDEPLLLRRQYRLEDFLWTGSGDGPHPSEQDGGLAWEDNGGGGTPHYGGPSSIDPQRSWIRVTKTMTLYRTVLTTIYPVEMTPTVISGHSPVPTPAVPEPSPTPVLPVPGDHLVISASPSSEWDTLVETDVVVAPTPVFSPTAPPEPTAAPPSHFSSTPTSTPSPDIPPPDNSTQEATTNPVFWIQTSIKANNTVYRDTPHVFQQSMQKSLAHVYAQAFKRHLLSTLGVLSPPSNPNSSYKNRRRKRRRKRRWTYHGDDYGHGSDDDEGSQEEDDNFQQWLYVAQSSMSPTQLKQLATAAMNVTVTLINVTEEAPPKVDLRYVVFAEGTPVPASYAVKELRMVTKREMEEMLGYVIINKKAEALVAGPPEQMTRNERYVATSPWLIVAVTTICLLVILLALIGFMVWKWKHNRLGDAGGGHRTVVSSAPPARPQSGIGDDDDEHDHGGGDDEEGVINPAFLGTPKRTGRDETLDQSPKSSPASRSLLSARHRALTATKRISEVISRLPSGKSKGRGMDGGEGGKGLSVEDEIGEEKGRERKGRKEERWRSPSSSEDMRVHKRLTTKPSQTSSEGSADWKELLGEPRPKIPAGTSARKRSPVRGAGGKGGTGGKPGTSAMSSKEVLRRKRRKSKVAEEASLRIDFEGEEDDDDEMERDFSAGEEIDTPPPPKQQQPWTKGITDAISLGNLDIFQDSAIAQTPSEYARKLVPWKRPGSAVGATGSSSSSSQPYFLPTGILEPSTRRHTPGGTRIQTIEEVPSVDQQDRELNERSESPPSPPASSPPVDTKEAGVQTPTRISKTASHKQRAAPKPRKSWKGSPGGGESSVISTESEEIVEVHHVGGGLPEDQNPLGRMRKRFHQFLDDAFNVMVSGGRNGDEDPQGGEESNRRSNAGTSRRAGGRAGETQSAKVSISHEVVETETEWRPWTSHVIREETLQKLRRGRPKSAAVPTQPIGPPKPAWTASSERRTHSAKGSASGGQPGFSAGTSRMGSAVDVQQGGFLMSRSRDKLENARNLEEEGEEIESYDKTSTREDPAPLPNKPVLSSSATSHPQSSSLSSQSQSVILSPAFIFPQYPAYPDIRVTMGGGGDSGGPPSGTSTGSSNLSQSQAPPPPSLHPNDPAVPLIQAIKNEMKKFEKDPPSGASGGGGGSSK